MYRTAKAISCLVDAISMRGFGTLGSNPLTQHPTAWPKLLEPEPREQK